MTDPPSGVHRRVKPLKAIPIDDLAEAAVAVGGVRRSELESGDRVIVSTKNSVYSLVVRGDGLFDISGGWFEREGTGPDSIEVLGCTAGGHALFSDHIAAPGLFMEFADGLRTTRIRTVRLISAAQGFNDPIETD
ncbi:MAG: hypothetical protein LJE93_05385 [Acidobacteria bacterium]|jgi:hypothetical protein|nr:hypothetical protein [Acidobacteriota bacterium]